MDTKYSVIYYRTASGEVPFSRFLDSLDEKQQAKIIRDFQYVKEYGLETIRNHVRKISGTPLWEIRIVGKDNIRVIYVLPKAHIVLVLHGFIKKKQKTPEKEIQTAIDRFKDWSNRTVDK